MITHNRVDWLLRSSGPSEVIDLGEPAGLENVHLVLVSPSDGDVAIEGCAEPSGTFAEVQTVTLAADVEFRERIPLEFPRYIRLAGQGAVLTVCV